MTEEISRIEILLQQNLQKNTLFYYKTLLQGGRIMNKKMKFLCLILSASLGFTGTGISAAGTDSRSADSAELCRYQPDASPDTPQAAPAQAAKQGAQAECLKRMLMLNQKLYIDTGEISTAPRCGVMDGTVKKTVSPDKIPSKEGQSNFGKGYPFQYGRRQNRIEVRIDDTFHIFAYNENNLDGVSMKIRRSSAKSATLAITNKSGRDIIFESAFRLEKKNYKKGEWQDVAYKISDFGFDDIAYTADKGSPVFWKADWDWLYGTLKPGTYRIVKTFYENAQNSREAFWTLSAKFRIEP